MSIKCQRFNPIKILCYPRLGYWDRLSEHEQESSLEDTYSLAFCSRSSYFCNSFLIISNVSVKSLTEMIQPHHSSYSKQQFSLDTDIEFHKPIKKGIRVKTIAPISTFLTMCPIEARHSLSLQPLVQRWTFISSSLNPWSLFIPLPFTLQSFSSSFLPPLYSSYSSYTLHTS